MTDQAHEPTVEQQQIGDLFLDFCFRGEPRAFADQIIERFLRPLQQRAERAEREHEDRLAELIRTIKQAGTTNLDLRARIATLEGEAVCAAAADEACAIAAQNTIDDLTRKLDASARLVEALRGALEELTDTAAELIRQVNEDRPRRNQWDALATLVEAKRALALTPASLTAEVAAERAVADAALDAYAAMMADDGWDDSDFPEWETLGRALDALAALRASRGTEA